MNHKRIPHNYIKRPDKKNLLPRKAGQQQQVHLSQSKSSVTFPEPIDQRGVDDASIGPMTTEALLSRAKRNIECSVTSLRAAAEDIAIAYYDRKVTQREVARGVGKSVAWVNRLLKWREGGCVGAPFADKIVQGVNKDDSPPEAAPTEPPSDVIAPSALTNEAAATSEGERPAAPAIAQATKTLSDAPIGDYHLPQELNRQDHERAFQRLDEQWSSIPFRNLFLDSPKAAQLRFLREVVLPEVGGLEALNSLPSGDGGGQ